MRLKARRSLVAPAWLLAIGAAAVGMLLLMGIMRGVMPMKSPRQAIPAPERDVRVQMGISVSGRTDGKTATPRFRGVDGLNPESRVVQSALSRLHNHGRHNPCIEI
ncbi:MAG: hypothetical protein PHF00_13610 [Elusimicrobia bacterium]|nr:hypothetical protein [Elusimicrobiota bacterium]